MKKEIIMNLIAARFASGKEYEIMLKEVGNMLSEEELKVVEDIADRGRRVVEETGDVMAFDLMSEMEKHADVFGLKGGV